jgi:hypothetical protein
MTARYEMTKAGLEGTKQMRNEVWFNSLLLRLHFLVVTNTYVKEGDGHSVCH